MRSIFNEIYFQRRIWRFGTAILTGGALACTVLIGALSLRAPVCMVGAVAPGWAPRCTQLCICDHAVAAAVNL